MGLEVVGMAFLDDELEVTTRNEQDVTIIDLKGDVTTFADAKITDAYRAATVAGARKLVLNFRRSDYINSAGIAILIRIVTEVNRGGQKLAMSGLNDHFQKIFRMVGLSQYADIYDDEAQAIAALAPVENRATG
jgi:anti-anti-sigma factor